MTTQPKDQRERCNPQRRIVMELDAEAYDYIRDMLYSEMFHRVAPPEGETTACNECNHMEDHHDDDCWVGRMERDLQAAQWKDEL